MPHRSALRRSIAGLAILTAACGGREPSSPAKPAPAQIAPVTDLSRSAPVGTTLSAGLIVKVTDADGRPVQGVNVAFAVTQGNGSTSPRLVATDANGNAISTWTLGTIVGTNQVTASVNGVATPINFVATGTAGTVSTISLSTQNARLLANVDTVRIGAQALDSFGNVTTPGPTFVVRDPTLLTIDDKGLARALRRGASTYVVAVAGQKSDSTLVTVLAAGQSICTAVANPIQLAVGQVVTDVSGTGVCVHATTAGAEYALIPFYNSVVPSATISVEAKGQGLATLSSSSLASMARVNALGGQALPGLVPDYAREARMRAQENAEARVRLARGMTALRANRTLVGGATATQSAQAALPNVGDLIKLNADAQNFCADPKASDLRTARVVAITNRAIVVADTANPVGGFTDEEYRSIGVTFDTLVDPRDRKAFGDPSDIDGNGHVIMFFTRAVNELTQPNASAVFLGYTYQRDLYPKTGPLGLCPGSNVAEMFYLLVPDTSGIINGNKRSKADVVSFTLGTVAHEYQHLINASRRLYVNKFGAAFEERWLDEGLAHIAEDINFWKSSGQTPGHNLDVSLFQNPSLTSAYNTFELFNQRRYQQYLSRTENQSPIGLDATDDDLQTRGAIWNFLRYAADRLGPANEDAFWFKLVNDSITGRANLSAALGTDLGPWLRDWAISVFMDDNAPNVDARFTQPSLNLRSIITNNGTSVAYPLVTRVLSDNLTTTLLLAADGVSFLRFSVANGQEALLTVTSSGQPLPASVPLAVVRVK